MNSPPEDGAPFPVTTLRYGMRKMNGQRSKPPAMEAYQVSRAVKTPRNNHEDLLQQIA